MIPTCRYSMCHQQFVYLLHILLGSTIYDPALSLMSLDIVQYTVVRITSAFPVHNLEEQIRSVKSCDNRDRRFKSKILDDIPPYYICCCSGKRTHNRAHWQLIYKIRYFQIAWSEILSPLGYAMSLINCHHCKTCLAGKIQKLRSAKSLRGNIHECISALSGIFQSFSDLSFCQCTIDIRSVNSRLVQCLNLIYHK